MPVYIEKISPTIYNETRKSLENKSLTIIYTPQKLQKDIDDHLDSLMEAIPPIEEGKDLLSKKEAEFSTILNIGWIALLTGIEKLRVRETEKAEKAEKLHALLLKAVELSEARRKWSGT